MCAIDSSERGWETQSSERESSQACSMAAGSWRGKGVEIGVEVLSRVHGSMSEEVVAPVGSGGGEGLKQNKDNRDG